MLPSPYLPPTTSALLFDYVGAKDADKVIVLMGSGADAVEETVNYLTAKGEKATVLPYRRSLFRRFWILRDWYGNRQRNV